MYVYVCLYAFDSESFMYIYTIEKKEFMCVYVLVCLFILYKFGLIENINEIKTKKIYMKREFGKFHVYKASYIKYTHFFKIYIA